MYKNFTKFRCRQRACMREMLDAMNPLIRIGPVARRKVIMRVNLATILMITTMLQVSAASMAQKLTLHKKNIPLSQIFKEIRKQTGYTVLVAADKLDVRQRVNADFNQTSLPDVLNRILTDKSYSFQIEEKNILIKKKEEPSFIGKVIERFQEIDVTGRVVDENRQPLTGANVSVKGTGLTTVTGANGNFSLSGVEEGATLLITFIGFQSRELPAAKNIGTIILQPSDSPLDEVQVKAYGTTSRRLNTGNISSVKAEDIAKQPVNNPLLALQGRVPGLMINQSSGVSGSNVTVRIQGINSIANGNDPFYVIDGVPYSSQNFRDINNTSVSGILSGGSPLAMINPATIESIEVLKDADATAIYGSRAANGAILITTKKGKAGVTKVDVQAQQGWGEISRKLDLLNTEQYLVLRREAYFTNDKLTETSPAYATAYDINGTWDQNRYTDWQKELIGGTSRWQDYQGNVSGGNSNTQFLFGANYHRETSVFPGDNAARKSSVQFNLNHRSSNNKFRFQLSTNYLDDINQLPGNDLSAQAVLLAPNAPALYLPDGTINWQTLANGNSTWTNPLNFTLMTYGVRAQNLLANSILSYTIIPGLNIQSSFGYNLLQDNQRLKTPLTYYNPELRATTVRSLRDADRSVANWIVEPQLISKKVIGKGVFDGLLGMTFQSTDSKVLDITASGFATDGQIDNIKSAPSVLINSGLESQYRYTALFGRLGYAYDSKYLINLTARRDGTSRFGSENRFNTFYAVSGAWIFSEEKFIKNLLPLLSFGKVRASYGTTGSDQVGDYRYLNLYSSTSGAVPYQGATGLAPNGLTNPYLQWEQTNKFNLGLDLGFFKDRILLNANFYRNTSGNQLLPASLPSVAGFTSINQNLPAKILNQGWEFSLDAKTIAGKDFTWTTNVNLTIPTNKLLEFPNLSSNSSYKNLLVIGEPISIAKGYAYAGVNPFTGLYQFVAANGTLTSGPSSTTDQTQIINLLPTLYGGFQNSIKYKGFQMDVLLQYVKQNARDYRNGNLPGQFNMNQPETFQNRWSISNSNAEIQKVVSNYAGATSTALFAYGSSDGNYVDASYVRLKNASLSWALPAQWSTYLKIQSARAFIIGQNLWTLTDFMLDPETKLAAALPTLKTVAIGLQISL